MSKIIEIDGFDFDLASLPAHNVVVLLTAAIGHKMRNETASKVVGGLRREALKALPEDASDEAKEAAIKSVKFDGENFTHVSAKREAQTAMAELIRTGTLGESAGRAPAKTPLEVEVDKLVRSRVIAVLVAKGLWAEGRKLPKADHVFAFATGNRSFDDLLEGFRTKNEATVTKDAQAVLDRRAREAAKAAAEATKAEGLDF